MTNMGQMGEKTPFVTSSWEKPHLKHLVREFLPYEPYGGNIPKSNMLVGFFLPYGKNNPTGFFLPWDFSWDS